MGWKVKQEIQFDSKLQMEKKIWKVNIVHVFFIDNRLYY